MKEKQATIHVFVTACPSLECTGIDLEISREEWDAKTEGQRIKEIQEAANESGMVDMWATEPSQRHTKVNTKTE